MGYKCIYCEKEYSDKGNLALHQKECSLNPNKEEDVELICQHCRKEVHWQAGKNQVRIGNA